MARSGNPNRRGEVDLSAGIAFTGQSANPTPSGLAGIYADATNVLQITAHISNLISDGAIGANTLSSTTTSQAGTFLVTGFGSPIASATTIAPTKQIHHVTGSTTISTITPPASFAGSFSGQITLIPDGLWSTNTAGNIALATTAVVSKALIMTYDPGAGKWYPSY